mgnify:FL=1
MRDLIKERVDNLLILISSDLDAETHIIIQFTAYKVWLEDNMCHSVFNIDAYNHFYIQMR